MRRFWLVLPILAWCMTSVHAEEAGTEEKDTPFAVKARELTAGKESRVEKVMALHAFVRDRIEQVETRYGRGVRCEIPHSRALGDAQGSQQARAELLGELLAATGEKVYMLRHGLGDGAYRLILLRVTQHDAKRFGQALGKEPKVLRMGQYSFIALPLEPGASLGTVNANLYNPSTERWTSTIAVMWYR